MIYGSPLAGSSNQERVPASYFAWEESQGLSHHCPVCATPEHATSILLGVCLGEHVMPCHKYHQQLFWPNLTRDCKACTRSREEHLKRHKAIATALRDLENLRGDKPSNARSDSLSSSSDSMIERKVSSAKNLLTRKENKAAKKLGKALKRTADNITGADVARVAGALHPAAHDDQGEEEDFMELDDPLFPDVLLWDKWGYAWYGAKVTSDGQTIQTPDFDVQTDEALRLLKIDLAKIRLNKEQRAAATQLRLLVKSDFEKVWNEDCETAKRRGGFLRFVHGSTLTRMTELRNKRLARSTKGRRSGEEELGPPEAAGDWVEDGAVGDWEQMDGHDGERYVKITSHFLDKLILLDNRSSLQSTSQGSRMSVLRMKPRTTKTTRRMTRPMRPVLWVMFQLSQMSPRPTLRTGLSLLKTPNPRPRKRRRLTACLLCLTKALSWCRSPMH